MQIHAIITQINNRLPVFGKLIYTGGHSSLSSHAGLAITTFILFCIIAMNAFEPSAKREAAKREMTPPWAGLFIF
jgi:hypothetical protein